ncbi:hypothetical protein DJ564_16170 [Pseudomonas sp. 31-12]|uniref:hypothetical protein n=1 Tax=unclassified Pseudomonas TaxID=196821 RepID=UPI000D6DA4F1|nr:MULTISPECIES: hypothetical protein [unclassified Pseudomonas]AWM92255.1 hypothetical protein DJ564_16170 [Pseudomonas sp. 31-12]
MTKLLTRKDLERELAQAKQRLAQQSEELDTLRERMESTRSRDFFEKFYAIADRYGFTAEEARAIILSDSAQISDEQWDVRQRQVSESLSNSLEDLFEFACTGEIGQTALRKVLDTGLAKHSREVEESA